MLRSLQRCDEGSDMHNDLKLTLEYVDELGRLKLANAFAEAFDIDTQAPGRDRQSGDDSSAEKSWLGTDWVLSDDGGRTLRCTPDAGTRPSHTARHEGTFPAQTTSRGASMDYDDPPRMSPQFLVDLPIMVDAYLSPHQACPPHL
nr:hypothetical protein CFP56_74284 [Quercus suber]